LEQTFSATVWAGKRLRLNGAVKADVRLPGGAAQLYIEARPKPPASMAWVPPPIALAGIDPPVRSSSWTRCAVELDGAGDPHGIAIGCAMAGDGAAWFGDLALQEVGCSLPPVVYRRHSLFSR